jgi:electron transfer flavoprotein alpha subunit
MDDPDSYGVEMGLQLAAKAGGRAERRRTGKTVKPTVYLAVGISGAARDLVGMKNSKNITAINKDEEAPILAISDLGVIGDARKICLNSSKRWKPAADRAMGASSGE